MLVHTGAAVILYTSLFTASALAQSLSGIWSPSTDKTRLFSTTSWTDFTNTWFKNDVDGFIMWDYEVLIPKGAGAGPPVYYGLSRNGPAASHGYSAGWVVADWNNFTAMWDKWGKGGLLMHDFESYEIAGTQWYAGVFHPVAGKKQSRYFTTNAAAAKQTREQTVKNGYYTQDWESYLNNGVRWYAAVFREGGSGEEKTIITTNWQSFLDQWDANRKAGLRMHDYETYTDNGVTTFVGVCGAGTRTNDWAGYFGVDDEQFRSMDHLASSKWGMALDDFEVAEHACNKPGCLSQVNQPWKKNSLYVYWIAPSQRHCEGDPSSCSGSNWVPYSQPTLDEDSHYFIFLDAVTKVTGFLTLPFNTPGLFHNGWKYGPGTADGTWHFAVDYAHADLSQTFDIRAAAPGLVIHVGWDTWSGNTVIISHNSDTYRTIYMHMRNGAKADCAKAYSDTIPTLSGTTLANYQKYLTNTCTGTPSSVHWGTEADTIKVVSGQTVTRGQILGKAGSTGPGGCGCATGGAGPNTHLHIFFARKEAGKWWFFDPYGVYSDPSCYATSGNAGSGAAGGPCARYPSGWLGGVPKFP